MYLYQTIPIMNSIVQFETGIRFQTKNPPYDSHADIYTLQQFKLC